MTTIKYTEEQIKELKSNSSVKNVTSKHIIFTKEFKLQAVKLAEKYITSKEIFKQFWFPEYVINSNIPFNSLNRWKKLSKKWIVEKKKWRKKKEYIDTTKMTKDEYIEYLEAKLALMEELERLSNSGYS